MSDTKCPYCGHSIEPPADVPDAPYDDAQDHVRCDDCRGTGRDAVNPSDRCPTCDGSGWL